MGQAEAIFTLVVLLLPFAVIAGCIYVGVGSPDREVCGPLGRPHTTNSPNH